MPDAKLTLPKKKKIVYVEWEDASAYHRWETVEQVTRTPHLCRSVGVLLERSDAGIVLAAAWCDSNQTVGSTQFIPASCVTRVVKLGEAKPRE